MRVAIITQYYPPEPVRIPHGLAHGFADRGHGVRVLTAYPNYPDGEIAEGYRQRWNRREDDRRRAAVMLLASARLWRLMAKLRLAAMRRATLPVRTCEVSSR